jgi:hypothetical protein
MPASESRIDQARRRVRVARHSIVAVAAAAFAVIGLAARAAHPATHTSGSSSASTAATSSDSQDGSFSFDGGGSISPSSSFDTPSIQSGGS